MRNCIYHKKKYWLNTIGILFALGVFILLSNNNLFIEIWYSAVIYPKISFIQRSIWGWASVSIGDIIYLTLGLYIITLIIKILFNAILRLKKLPLPWFKPDSKIARTEQERHSNQGNRWKKLHRKLNLLLIVYLIFLILWGLNYHRIGIIGQLNIKKRLYESIELKKLNEDLLKNVNSARSNLKLSNSFPQNNVQLFAEADKSYQQVSRIYPFLQYKQKSIKSSIFGPIGNYLGFSGYYNPFTGEAQVNTTVPVVLRPFITCHEIAHQLGYADEAEANFVGYLSAVHSDSPAFRYSAYLEMFLYANRNYYQVDSAAARKYRESLLPEVQSDIRDIIRFNKAHESLLEPLFTIIFDLFLKAQQQKQGVMSYNEVVGLLIGYNHSKFKSKK